MSAATSRATPRLGGWWRIRIVLSALWIAPIGIWALAEAQRQAGLGQRAADLRIRCLAEHERYPALGNRFDCFNQEAEMLQGASYDPSMWVFVGFAIVPPAVLLVLGATIGWVAAGFRQDRAA